MVLAGFNLTKKNCILNSKKLSKRNKPRNSEIYAGKNRRVWNWENVKLLNMKNEKKN